MASPSDLSHQSHHHQQHQHSLMAKYALRSRALPCFTDGCLFLGGALTALLLVWSYSAAVFPNPNSPNSLRGQRIAGSGEAEEVVRCRVPEDSLHDPPEKTFYDDPELSYAIERPVKGWDEKRQEWLRRHPSFAGGPERVVLVTGSQAELCLNKIGDHLLLRYTEIESGGGEDERVLRRRHAENVREFYSRRSEPHFREAGYGQESLRRPFVTHFTGCQPCSGNHNPSYSAESCWNRMVRALNFADNQLLRNYGYVHPDLLDSAVDALPFDYPAAPSAV